MLEVHFGKFNKTRGKTNNCLGINIGIRDDKKVEIDMIEQLEAIINNFSEEISGKVLSPASKWSYKLGDIDNRKSLVGKKKEEFHSFVQKLLHLCKRTRPDLYTVVAYLTTRVSKSTNFDWYKLKRVLHNMCVVLHMSHVCTNVSSLNYSWIRCVAIELRWCTIG